MLAVIAVYPLVGKSSPYKSGLLIFAGIYIIIAVGLDLLMGYTGQISVGHAAFFAIGAYTSGILTAKCGFSPAVAMGAGVVLSMALAFGIGRPVLALKEYYLAMATLAFNEIVITLIIGFEGITGGASGLRDIPHLQYLRFFAGQPHSLLLFCLGSRGPLHRKQHCRGKVPLRTLPDRDPFR